ncbi:hypothetical protein ES703_35641 [subsurface metagenome]
MEFQEPLIIEPNKTLYFEYVVNISWTEPIRVEVENIDLSSIRVIYDYNYLLKPEHYDWYAQLYSMEHSYENIAYSFKEEPEYRVVQYYYEAFTVYENVAHYTHTFDIGDLSFEVDFVNSSVYKIIGLTPSLDFEILSDNDDFSIEFNTTSNQLTITDWNASNGLLDSFDQITVILNYSYGPISSYSEIYLLEQFNQTYLTDFEKTFYNYVDLDYQYSAKSGTALFAEGSSTITSDATSFESIDYCRNPDISNINNKLIGYGSELFDNFEIYLDDSSVLYAADIDMDSEADYKHTIDVNKDGKIDITKYGIDDPQGSGEIYWHTVIQDFENHEIQVSRQLEEEKRTEWFDINDRAFAHYDFNIGKLLSIVLTLPLLPYHISKMILPDVDYWGQKSTQNLISKEEHIKSTFYSVKVDSDRDGLPNTQVNYEKTDVDIYYEITEYRKTILAAKFQNIFTYLGEYVARSISSLFTGSYEDFVFNDQLAEEHLESQDFSTCNRYTQANAPTLTATYRKFTENITTTYIDTFEQSTITVIDFDDEGEIEEQRIYRDDFENYEVDNIEEFFSDLAAEHSVTNLDTGQQSTVSFDPELPFTHFANLTWEGETWGSDNVPVKYDSLQVIGEDNSYSTNVFERTIIIRIPNRFSLYHDYRKTSRAQREDNGGVEFEVTGILIRPPDGKVYYTSDAESFVKGRAKTSGYYFYVDSDQNLFYETVYILSDTYLRPDESGIPQYNVMSIGLNYDGLHDFSPYEKLDQKTQLVSDFDNLARESTKFGTDWVYNFNNLRNCELLWETESKVEELGLKPKDQIFEIYKLVEPSEQNSKFSKLFYEIRHETYSTAWEHYRKQLAGDIIEQVFMSVTAGILSATVEAIITGATLGFGAALGKALGALTYFTVYMLMTKFSIDMKLHEAHSRERSQTFYAISNEKREPTSLNEKAIDDRILQDSMAAALLAHPGGYYTTVSGGEPGNEYTAQALVSPPNYNRLLNAFGGFLELLWENLWSMGESDPDSFTALDFDDLNLNYFLLTSELPSYNQRLYHRYVNTDDLFNQNNWYWANTLGYLERAVRGASNNQLDAIRPTCIDGRPHYEFINSTLYQAVLPMQVLYRPIVLSEERYNQLNPALGHMVIEARCIDYSNTKGVNPYAMGDVERKAGYKAKIPLNDNGFEYPIQYISIDVVKSHTYKGVSYFAQDLIINESYYIVVSGNLYFLKSIEEIISEKYQGFEDALSQTWIKELVQSTIYYKIHIFFDVFVPDTTEETNNLALAQATFYTIMDYFNQYTYAEISANMISEIAYTETLTFWSTLISAPLVFLGSWAVKGTELMFGQVGVQLTKVILQMVTAPIKEVFEEIIKDGFIEALSENIVDLLGGTEDMGFWVSSLGTSYREVKGALGQIALGSAADIDIKINLGTKLSLFKARLTGDTEIINQIQQELQQKHEAELAKQQQMKSWQKLLGSGFFKGISMVTSTLFFGSFNFFALNSLKNLITDVKTLSPKAYGELRSKLQAYRINKFLKRRSDLSVENIFVNNLKDSTKHPADIDGEALNNLFRGRQESNIYNPPAVDISILFNPNPMTDQRNELAKKFQQIQVSDWISELVQDPRLEDKKAEFETIRQNSKNIDFQKAKEDIVATIRDALQDKKDLRYVDINGIVMYDPNFALVGLPHFNPEQEIDVVFSQPIKDFVKDLKRQYYTISYDIKLMLYKSGSLIEIDQNSEEDIAHWLIRNGYSKDETIYILPADKEYR